MYWDIPTIKARAKRVISNHFGEYFLATVVCGIICGYAARIRIRLDLSGLHFRTLQDVIDYLLILWSRYYPSIIASLALSVFTHILWKIFVANPFETGSCRYRTLATYKHYDFQNVFFSFSGERYTNIVLTMFIRDVYLIFYTLLLIVPGIIKSYSYFMVPYILAENPGISSKRAFEISESVTVGEKRRIFVLNLSFIGWFLLGALCFGVGILFVLPYYEAAQAELYGALRFKAVRERLVEQSEIGAELF